MHSYYPVNLEISEAKRIAHLIKNNILQLAKVVVDQDPDILGKIYPDTPQKIKLNNEVGMDWVRRNFESFPTIVEPHLSKQKQ